MATTWHPDDGVATTPAEMEQMAAILEGRHGIYAAEVAEFFAVLHGQNGDAARSWAWNGVAEAIRQREQHRGTEN